MVLGGGAAWLAIGAVALAACRGESARHREHEPTEDAGEGGTGGGSGRGGSSGDATSGRAAGGTAAGGISSGGTSTGGTAAGGASTGGTAAGGISTGGASTGGASGADPGAGAGGEPDGCAGMGASCPDGCFEIPVVTGCGPDRTSSKVCTGRTFPVDTTACGFRQQDSRLYYIDAPYETDPSAGNLIPNPFASIDGFRSCSQSEVDVSDCRDFSSEPSAGALIFRITNERTGPIWVLISGVGCTPFRIERLPDSEPVTTGYLSTCAGSCGPFDPQAGSGRFRKIEPAGLLTPTWNQLENELETTIGVCGQSDSRCTRARTHRALGNLRATLVVVDDPTHPLVQNCEPECSPSFTPPSADGAMSLCHGAVTGIELVSVEFSAQASGAQTVAVVID